MFTRMHDVNNTSTWKGCMCLHVNNKLIPLDLICFPLLCTPSRVYINCILKQLNMLCHQRRVEFLTTRECCYPKHHLRSACQWEMDTYINTITRSVWCIYISSWHMVGCTGRSNTAALTSEVVMAGLLVIIIGIVIVVSLTSSKISQLMRVICIPPLPAMSWYQSYYLLANSQSSSICQPEV